MSPNDRPNGNGRSAPPYKPLTVSEIADEAERYEWKPQVPLKYWIGALETLYREGKNYALDGNYARAYLLLLRCASLYLRHVSAHPHAKLPENKRLLKPIKDRLPQIFSHLEVIKPIVAESYEEWAKITQSGKEVLTPSSNNNELSYEAFAARDAALSWNVSAQAKLIDATSNQDLAVELATKEFQRRGASRRADREGGNGRREDEYQPRHRGGRPSHSDLRSAEQPVDDLQQQMEAIRWRLDSSQRHLENEDDRVAPGAYTYPTISRSTPVTYDRDVSRDAPTRPSPVRPARPPKQSIPPLEVRTDAREPPANLLETPPQVPQRAVRPSDALFNDSPQFSDSPLTNSRNHETVEPSPLAPNLPPKEFDNPSRADKQKVTFKPAGYFENGEPIRPIFLPSELRGEFIRLATANTAREIETCGLLCGSVVNNALFVNTLLVPEQVGTTDTCETTNEAAIFEFMDREELIQLGWIHTHPTQTCFMSSRDLHTHAGYQIMIPESIAIVCAPRYEPSWGIFRLTNPPGVPHLLKCDKTSTFHEHDVPANQLYVDAQHPPGHVFVSNRLSFKVHDLRSP